MQGAGRNLQGRRKVRRDFLESGWEILPKRPENFAAPFLLNEAKFNKGLCMRRLVWLAGIVWALAPTETILAIPVNEVKISVTGGETLRSMEIAKAKASLPKAPLLAPTSTAQKATASAVQKVTAAAAQKVELTSPLLSSLVPLQEDRILSTIHMRRDGYTPESLDSNYDPKAATGLHRRTPPTGGKGTGDPATVPDGGATAGLFGIALMGTALMKRKLTA
jgi:hypothetical protein